MLLHIKFRPPLTLILRHFQQVNLLKHGWAGGLVPVGLLAGVLGRNHVVAECLIMQQSRHQVLRAYIKLMYLP